MHQCNGKGFLPGAMIGMIIGGIAGVMLAPKSGKETRQMIKEKAMKLKGKGEEIIEQNGLTKGKIKEIIREVMDDIEE